MSDGTTVTTPKWRSWSTIGTTARASPRCCSSTWRRLPGRTGSSASPPRRSATTAACSPSSPRPVGPCTADSTLALSTSTSRSPTTPRTRIRSSAVSNAPTRRAMARLLLATSIAVIGASDDEMTIGGSVWRRLAADSRRPRLSGQPASRRGQRGARVRGDHATFPTRWGWRSSSSPPTRSPPRSSSASTNGCGARSS